MRSINIKRAVAVVAGAAMVASVVAPALAAVGPTQNDVNSLVANIKANPASTRVIVGETAAISDAYNAAKIVALLSAMNYEQTTLEGGTPTYTGSKSVTITTTGAGLQPGLTESDYTFEEISDLAATTKMIDQSVMPGLFSEYEIRTTTGAGTGVTLKYGESLSIDGTKIVTAYGEDNNNYGMGTSIGRDALIYKMDYTIGDPVEITQAYNPLPQVKILGREYVMDTVASTTSKLIFYAGSQYTFSDMSKTQEVDGYTVSAEFISGSGITGEVAFKVISPTGTSQIQTIGAGNYFDFFAGTDNKFTIHVSSAQSNYQGTFAVATMGPGKLELQDGQDYSEDKNWRVRITTVNNVVTGFDELQSIELLQNVNYAGITTTNPSFPMGQYLNGPMRLDGTIPFQFGVAGYSEADTAQVTFSPGDNDLIMNVKWKSPDGKEQVLETTRDEFGLVSPVMSADQPYTIINNKIVKLVGFELGTTDYVKFEIDGVERKFQITGGTTATLAVNLPNDDSITCTVTTDLTVSPRTATIANAATVCDTTATAVRFGNSIVFDTNPKMDLSAIQAVNDPIVLLDPYPQAVITPVIGPATITVQFDNQDLAQDLIDDDKGILVAGFVDLSKATIYEKDKYHILTAGTGEQVGIIDGSDGQNVVVTIPDKTRDFMLNLKAAGDTTGPAGSETMTEGQTSGTVTVNTITCPTATSTVSGTYYTQKGALTPESLIVWDSAASGTYHIVVGGPFVNKVAAQMTAKDMVTTEGASYVYAEGNKLLVAGYSATDTSNAVNELIQLLKA